MFQCRENSYLTITMKVVSEISWNSMFIVLFFFTHEPNGDVQWCESHLFTLLLVFFTTKCKGKERTKSLSSFDRLSRTGTVSDRLVFSDNVQQRKLTECCYQKY